MLRNQSLNSLRMTMSKIIYIHLVHKNTFSCDSLKLSLKTYLRHS